MSSEINNFSTIKDFLQVEKTIKELPTTKHKKK